jgi:hypothetical protein
MMSADQVLDDSAGILGALRIGVPATTDPRNGEG